MKKKQSISEIKLRKIIRREIEKSFNESFWPFNKLTQNSSNKRRERQEMAAAGQVPVHISFFDKIKNNIEERGSVLFEVELNKYLGIRVLNRIDFMYLSIEMGLIRTQIPAKILSFIRDVIIDPSIPIVIRRDDWNNEELRRYVERLSNFIDSLEQNKKLLLVRHLQS